MPAAGYAEAMNTTVPPDCILISGLELPVRIGVPEEERAGWQTLRADLELRLRGRVEAMGDDLSATVDYDAAARQVRALAADKPRCLIETLAGEIAELLLRQTALSGVTVTLRKRILPGVDDVAVRVVREQ